ncbi:M1 family aminopeptidase [Clostridium frigidicarnis]|uniref:Peptidase family M1 n=1 Tax=Clostridium frigidicarnis TaxID=84698 RepID=A0A1I0XPV8_9CLOT|nr:M1 family aminopeptidase [Clostridium frigidicarnis]SFB02238.1 Peptidase family M1 [Clostridium frigidicarnis]
MNFFSYLRVELNRIFHSKTVYLIMILTMLCPMAGYKLYKITKFSTLCGDLIADPTMAGALIGGVLFALLTLIEFDRVRKHETGVLISSIVSPLVMNVVRVLAIIITAIVCVTITSLLYFPYTVIKAGNTFDAYTYWNSFFLLMLPSLVLSILAVSAFYQIFCRIDLSMVLFIAFIFISLSKWFSKNNIVHWIIPNVPGLSDYFSNTLIFRLMEHNRLFWFLVLGGLWLIGLLCVRRYGKRLFGSILHNLKKAYIPLFAVALISGAYYAYTNHPYIYKMSKANISDEVNNELQLSNTNLEISFDTSRFMLLGKTTYSLKNLSGSTQECIASMRPGFTFKHIKANEKDIAFENLNDSKSSVVFNLPEDSKINLTIEYSGIPKIDEKFSEFIFATSISDKYIDLMGSTEIYPRLEVATISEDSTITGKITIPKNLTLLLNIDKDVNNNIDKNNNDIVKVISEDDNNKTWLINVKGNDIFALMAGDYVIKKFGEKDMPTEFYYSRNLEDKMKNMNAEEMIKDTIDYCTTSYGKLYNVSPNNPLKIVQKTVFFPGGLGFPNFSTMQETDFSDKNLSDKLKGASSAEILAHEIIHQWFGIKSVGNGGNNENWSAEGLTVYTTYRVMKEKYGEEYAQKNYVDVWKSSLKHESNNFYNRHPEYLDILPQKYATEIKGENLVICHYTKMPLQILKAAKLVGGEDTMDKILAKLYKNSLQTPISWEEFLNACNLKEEDLNID